MQCELIRLGRELNILDIYEWTLGFIRDISHKRFEENIKFVSKLTFKKLKSSFLKKNRISFYSKKFDSKFYDYYFLDLANHLNIDIEEFYDPLNSKSGIKTLNNDYLNLLFKSQEFKKDFLEYLKSGTLIKDYQSALQRKVRQLLLKFDHLFNLSDPNALNRGIGLVQKYFRMNKQCKLPWTFNEIATAVQTFEFMVNSL